MTAGSGGPTSVEVTVSGSPHPRLLPHARVLRRPEGQTQVGIDPGTAVVILGLSATEVAWLRTVDGVRDAQRVIDDAAALGIDPARAGALLDELIDEELATLEDEGPAPCPESPEDWALLAEEVSPWATRIGRGPGEVIRLRSRARVLVDGPGTLAAAIADALSRSGIGHVERGLRAADARLTEEDWSAADRTAPDLTAFDLVVLVSPVPVAPDRARPWLRRGVPLLPVELGSTRGCVGPLVAGAGQPCLDCVESWRVDDDPGWPWIRAQITPMGAATQAPAGGDTGLRHVITGLAVMAALAQLDGTAQPRPARPRRAPLYGATTEDEGASPGAVDDVTGELGASDLRTVEPPGCATEVRLPGPTFARRRWPAHPECACGGAATEAARDLAPGDDSPVGAPGGSAAAMMGA
ncbi:MULTISPECIES: hypothetical protein [unclassified Janibacter]|uniref:hypothetical protein n=1 Tax=unclassified Janibacter TaxID=2649294 RepID=UPI003D025EF7